MAAKPTNVRPAFDKVIADVRIAKLGLDVSLELAKEAIPLGVQFQNAGKAGQWYDTWCRGSHERFFAWHIGSGERWCGEISGRTGDVVPRALVVTALLLAITTLAAALIVVTTLATAALTALALVTLTLTLIVSLALTLVVSPLATVVAAIIATVVAVAIALAAIVALTLALAALTLTMALAMTISATLTLTLLALALSSASVMTTPAASLAWGVTIRPFGMVCWPHVFRPVM